MPILYIMCGPTGFGKTTYCSDKMELAHCVYVSRDVVRYEIIKEEEDYFSHEKEVFREFIRRIVEAMTNGYDCIADATHLNQFSRRKLTQAIDMYTTDYKIIYVVFNVIFENHYMLPYYREQWHKHGMYPVEANTHAQFIFRRWY